MLAHPDDESLGLGGTLVRYAAEEEPPHGVAKLYYRVFRASEVAAFRSVFGSRNMRVEGVERHALDWDDRMITARVEAAPHSERARQAVACHHSQVAAGACWNGWPRSGIGPCWSTSSTIARSSW